MTASLLARLRRWLAGPRFADEETTRVAGVLHVILLVCLGSAALGLLAHLLVFGAGTLAGLRYLPLAALSVALLLALRRGHVRASGLILLVATWAGITLGALYDGGVRSNGLGSLMLIVIAATLLFDRRTVLVAVGMCLTTLTLLLALERTGGLPLRQSPDLPELAYVGRVIQFLSAGVFLWLAVHSLQGALARARAGEARAEQLLREAQSARTYADNVLSSMAESLIVLDAEGRIKSANRASLQLLATSAGELLGKPFVSVLADYGQRPEDRPRPGREPTPVERVYSTPGGVDIPVLFARSDLCDDRGKPYGAVCVATDITHLKRAEASLREAKELAEEASLAKSRFLANMSHELRTPLNAVIGYAEMLIEEVDERKLAGSLDELRKIQFAGKYLLGLISDILDLSKIEAGKMDVHLETFDVVDMIETVLGTIRPLADKNGNRLVVSCPDSIGFIHADLTKIRQILLNLLSNASKFTDRGEIRLTAAKTSRGGLSMIQFIVSDTGVGMTEQQLGKLFQAFSQGDNAAARRVGGTGLGLAISRAFCDILGGTIDVQSQLGVGTVFTVRLPYVDPIELSMSKRSGAFSRALVDAARAAALRARE